MVYPTRAADAAAVGPFDPAPSGLLHLFSHPKDLQRTTSACVGSGLDAPRIPGACAMRAKGEGRYARTARDLRVSGPDHRCLAAGLGVVTDPRAGGLVGVAVKEKRAHPHLVPPRGARFPDW